MNSNYYAAYPQDYRGDTRFLPFLGVLPFLGGLALGGIGGYAAARPYYPYPAPYPYPVPYPQPISYSYPQLYPTSYMGSMPSGTQYDVTKNYNFYSRY